MSCGVGCKRGSDPVLLWLWHKPAATASIRPLAWEPPCATGAALEKAKRPKKKKKGDIPLEDSRNVFNKLHFSALLPSMSRPVEKSHPHSLQKHFSCPSSWLTVDQRRHKGGAHAPLLGTEVHLLIKCSLVLMVLPTSLVIVELKSADHNLKWGSFLCSRVTHLEEG